MLLLFAVLLCFFSSTIRPAIKRYWITRDYGCDIRSDKWKHWHWQRIGFRFHQTKRHATPTFVRFWATAFIRRVQLSAFKTHHFASFEHWMRFDWRKWMSRAFEWKKKMVAVAISLRTHNGESNLTNTQNRSDHRALNSTEVSLTFDVCFSLAIEENTPRFCGCEKFG